MSFPIRHNGELASQVQHWKAKYVDCKVDHIKILFPFALGLTSGTDQPWSTASERDHMTYSQMASACLATQRHISSDPHTINQVHDTLEITQ